MRRTAASILAGFIGLFALGAAAVTAGCAHQDGPKPDTKSTLAAVASQPAPVVNINPSVKFVRGTSTGFMLTERLEFAEGKADLGPSSAALLGEVATVMKENPDLVEIYIAGFASSEGDADHNLKLSEDRAHAVRTWLVDHGVDAARLGSGGYGITHPAGDNGSVAGREMNRRVEFIALKYKVNGQLVTGTAPLILANPLEPVLAGPTAK